MEINISFNFFSCVIFCFYDFSAFLLWKSIFYECINRLRTFLFGFHYLNLMNSPRLYFSHKMKKSIKLLIVYSTSMSYAVHNRSVFVTLTFVHLYRTISFDSGQPHPTVLTKESLNLRKKILYSTGNSYIWISLWNLIMINLRNLA